VYAQTVAEFGLVGIVAVLIVILVVARLIARSLSGTSLERQALAMSAVFSLTYLAVHQLADMYLNVPAILFAGALPVALLDGAAPAEDAPSLAGPSLLRRAATPILAISCGLSLVAIAFVELRAIPAARIAPIADRGDWAGAAELARTAASDDPGLPGYHFLNGLAAANAGDTETAERELRISADADDYAFAWLNLAALALDRDDESAARASLERATRLGEQQAAVMLPAGALYLRLGDSDAAASAFADALTIAPMLTDDPYWQSGGPELAAAHDEAVDRVIAEGPPTLTALVALLSDDFDRATDAAAALDGDDRLVTQLAILAWQGDARAQADLEGMAAASPASRSAVTWLARLAAKNDDQAAVSRYRTWAATTAIAGNDIGEDVVVTDDPIPGAQVPGSNGNLQGWYVYQRQYPWDLLVPGLPNLTLQ
jgi:tetratricopeptide (TPR) repeat protein